MPSPFIYCPACRIRLIFHSANTCSTTLCCLPAAPALSHTVVNSKRQPLHADQVCASHIESRHARKTKSVCLAILAEWLQQNILFQRGGGLCEYSIVPPLDARDLISFSCSRTIDLRCRHQARASRTISFCTSTNNQM